MKSYTAVNFRN